MYIDNLTITGLITVIVFIAGLIRFVQREDLPRPRAACE